MRSFGIVLVVLAAASAYGLDRRADIASAVSVITETATVVGAAADTSTGVATQTRPVDVARDAVRPVPAQAEIASAQSAPMAAMPPAGSNENAAARGLRPEPAAAALYVPPIVVPNPALPSEPDASREAAADQSAVRTNPSPSIATERPSAAPVGGAPNPGPVAVLAAVAPQPERAPLPILGSPAATALPATAAPMPAVAGIHVAIPTQAPAVEPANPRVAKEAFGSVKTPAPMAARAIGFYSRGCLAGARMLPVDGPAWQAMRLSRNRNWGHPDLIRFVERLAVDARGNDSWSGLLVGDLSQPRGGPSPSDHASHQIGLDADIWLTPMPDRRLTPKEREDLGATNMLGDFKLTVDPAIWTPTHVRLIKRASTYAEVERVLVHPAIKKALCEAAGKDREWLKKVRPIWGHNTHFHVRIACPAGSPTCTGQAPPPGDDGCGKELDDWMQRLSAPVKPAPADAPPAPAAKPLLVDQLPQECRYVLETTEPEPGRLARSAVAIKTAAKAAQRATRKAARKAVELVSGPGRHATKTEPAAAK